MSVMAAYNNSGSQRPSSASTSKHIYTFESTHPKSVFHLLTEKNTSVIPGLLLMMMMVSALYMPNHDNGAWMMMDSGSTGRQPAMIGHKSMISGTMCMRSSGAPLVKLYVCAMDMRRTMIYWFLLSRCSIVTLAQAATSIGSLSCTCLAMGISTQGQQQWSVVKSKKSWTRWKLKTSWKRMMEMTSCKRKKTFLGA